MTGQVFYRKWRPQRFTDVVGQEYVTQTLLNALGTGRVAHAYLFCGPRGTGKTSTGRILAKALNCSKNGKGEPCNECPICLAITEGRALDLIEIDAASNRGIDEMRSLREKVNFSPNEGRYKVYIIDEVHMLTNEAFNALLKTLEEPPPHSIFILATTEAHKLPATVISRCQRFDFRRISLNDVINRLGLLCKDEGIMASPDVLNAVARSAGGSLRDAENIFEQLAVGYGHDLKLEQLREFLGLGGERQVKELVSAALRADVAAGLKTISAAAGEGLDLRQFHRQVMEQLRALLLIKAGAGDTVDIPAESRKELEAMASPVPLEQVVRAVKLFGQVDLRSNNYSTLPLELALVEAAVPDRAPSPPPARARQTAERAPAPAPAIPRPPAALSRPPAAHPPAPAPRQPAPIAPPKPEPPVATPAPSIAKAPTAGGPVAPPVIGQGPSPDGAMPLVDRLRQGWKAIIEASRNKGQRFKIDALLRSGEVIAVEPDAVVLGFPKDIFVDRMKQELDNPATRRALEESVGQLLGERRSIRCIVKPAQKKSGEHLLKAAMEMGAKVVDNGGNP